jgi:oxalate---CoA ligase
MWMSSDNWVIPSSFRKLLEQRASEAPSRPAILSPDRRPLTYGDWLKVTLEAERVLQRAGVAADERLAVIMPSNAQMASAIVALSGRFVLAPLSADSRVGEYERTFNHLGVTGVVVPATGADAARAAADRLALPQIEVFSDQDTAGAFTLNCERWWDSPRAAIAADVRFLSSTSGTTGEPKRVFLTAANLCSAAAAFSSTFALSADDRCLHAQAVFHTAAMVTLGASLCAGSSTVYLDDYGFPSLTKSLRDGGATWLSAPPAVYREFLTLLPDQSDIGKLANLRFVRSGAAALEQSLVEKLELVFAAPVIQVYGMTEAPFISCSPLRRGTPKPQSVGLAQRCEVRIVDADGQQLQSEHTGEVVVRGPNVISRFDDAAGPAEITSDGWFRTGDIGRLDDEGYLYLLGRRKELINRGGEKIFPREIEQVLRQDNGIADVAVFGIAHPTLGEEVAAAVILAPNATRTDRDVCGFAAERLAQAKVPKRVFVVSEFPRTATGKVKHHELRRLLQEENNRTGLLVHRSATLLEAQLVDVFEDVLSVTGLKSDDDFFTQGGDSLRAVRLMTAIRSLCGQDLSAQTLLEAPTPRLLARRINAALPASTSPLVCIQRGSNTLPLFFLNGDLDGSGMYVRNLVRELGAGRTVYTLYPHGINGTKRLDTIEAMATEYADIIERTVPEGPFALAGYCNGGVVAYEIARGLEARGRNVGPLILVAATAANGPFRDLRRLAERFGRTVGISSDAQHRLFLGARSRLLQLAQLRHAPISAYVRFLFRQAHHVLRRFQPQSTLGPADLAPFEHMGSVMARYVPETYTGPVHHIWGKDDVPLLPNDPSMGWKSIASQLNLYVIPGDHFTVVTREYKRVAQIMRHALDRFTYGQSSVEPLAALDYR